MSDQDQPKLSPDRWEILVYPLPDADGQGDDGPPLDCITADPDYVHTGAAGISLTGCWTYAPISQADAMTGDFIIGTRFYPWHRIAEASRSFHETSDSNIRAGHPEDLTSEELASWAEEHQLDAAKLRTYYDGFVRWNSR
jgi:hypothetical protein